MLFIPIKDTTQQWRPKKNVYIYIIYLCGAKIQIGLGRAGFHFGSPFPWEAMVMDLNPLV